MFNWVRALSSYSWWTIRLGSERRDKGVEGGRGIFKVVATRGLIRDLGREGRGWEGRQRNGRKTGESSKSVMTGSHTRGYQPLPRDPPATSSNTAKLGKGSESCDGRQRQRTRQQRRALAVFVARLLAVSPALCDSLFVRLPVLICFG